MANFANGVWTLFPGDVGTDVVPPAFLLRIKKIIFENYLSDQDHCELVNGEGKVVFSVKGDNTLGPIKHPMPCHTNVIGLRLQILDSGVCTLIIN